MINYADFANRADFWITRAFLLKLLPSMEEYLYSYATEPVNFLPQNSTSAETSATDGSTLSVTEKEGVLLEAVDMTYIADTQLFELRLRGKSTQAVAVLNAQMMMVMLKSIFSAAPHGQWGISPQLVGY